MKSSQRAITRAVWTDADFEQMGWHDATIHALAFREEAGCAELLLDIDYIVLWNAPVKPNAALSFTVAPATLIFENVWSLEGDLAADRVRLRIDAIRRCDPEDDRQRTANVVPWIIEGDRFEIRLLASGFRQHFRARAIDAGAEQSFALERRGGVSFAEPTTLPP